MSFELRHPGTRILFETGRQRGLAAAAEYNHKRHQYSNKQQILHCFLWIKYLLFRNFEAFEIEDSSNSVCCCQPKNRL
jgi:hypothetical protein